MTADRESIPPLALWLAVLASIGIAFAFLRGLNDSDLFWHLLNGERLMTTGAPVAADPYSFTVPGEYRPPHEWLSEALMHLSVTHAGPDLALALFALALPLGFGALGLALLKRGVPVLTIAVASVVPALVALPYASVRPQVLSWAFMACLVALLLAVDARRPLWILAAVPMFAAWANTHGLYVLGLCVLGWYAMWTLYGRTDLREFRWLVVGTTGAAVLASALSPVGIEGLFIFLRIGEWGLANIPEWRSPNFHDAVQLPLLVMVATLMVVRRSRTPGWVLGLTVIGVGLALTANRNAPVAAVLAFPMLAFGLRSPTRWLPKPPAGASQRARRLVESLAAAVVIVGAIMVAASNAGGIRLDRFPVEGVDRLARSHPDARVLAEYGWGGYVAYRLHDSGGRVFVDGRTDLYPPRVLNDYVAIRDAEAGWQELVAHYGVEAILLRPDKPLVRGVAQLHGWCERFRDADQVLLVPCGD